MKKIIPNANNPSAIGILINTQTTAVNIAPVTLNPIQNKKVKHINPIIKAIILSLPIEFSSF